MITGNGKFERLLLHASAGRVCAAAPHPSTNQLTPYPGTPSTWARRRTSSTRAALAGMVRSVS